MRGLFILAFISIFIASGCTNDPQKKAKKGITALEKELYEEQIIDREKGIELINSYVTYTKDYPQDSSGAMYLFKAGEIAMNLQASQQAIVYFKNASSMEGNFEKKPECMFLSAFIYENQLADLEKAGDLYRLFIKTYPDHVLVKDAKASILYLGKSPEELVKMFQEQNKE